MDGLSTDSSRPGSSSHSETSFATAITQRVESHDGHGIGSASLIQGIERVKALVSQQNDGGSNGVVGNDLYHFPSGARSASSLNGRPRSSSLYDSNLQSRVLHELETLRRRVYRSTSTSHTRHASQYDLRGVVASSEEELAFFPDERAEEVERLREEVQLERLRREEELEIARGRISDLEREKAELEAAIHRDGSSLLCGDSGAEKTPVLGTLHDRDLQVEELQESLAQAKKEHGDLLSLHKESELSSKGVQERLSQLQRQLDYSEIQHKTMLREIEQLRSSREPGLPERTSSLASASPITDETKRAPSTSHQAREEALHQRYAELQTSHDSLAADLSVAQAREEQLEESIIDGEIQRRELLEQLDKHKRLLLQANLDVDSHSRELHQLLADYQAAKSGCDEFRTLLQDALACTTEMEGKVRVAERRAARAEENVQGVEESLGRELAERSEELAEVRVHVLEMQGQLAEAQSRATDAEADLEETQAELRMETMSKDNQLVQMQRQLSELRNAYDDSVSQLEVDRSQTSLALSQEESEAQSAQTELELQEAIDRAVEEATDYSRAEMVLLKETHAATIKELHRQLEQSSQEALAKLEDRHEAALGAALASADDDLEDRLRDQARSHGEELDQLREHLQNEIARLQFELQETETVQLEEQSALALANDEVVEELSHRLEVAEQASAELSEKNATATEELAALQARLDAEFTAHAEAERALADLRKRQRASIGEKRADDDSKEALQRRVAALQGEVDAIIRQRDAAPSPDAGPTPISALSVDAEALQEKNFELARQNEFLAKELEGAFTRIATPQAFAKIAKDAGVQADLETTSKRSEGLASGNGVRSAGRPRASSTRSLDAYLEHAEVELSSLGAAAGLNEKLFAVKVLEHGSELQLAKEFIDRDYQDRYNVLLTAKRQMERTVMAKSAADFSKDRTNLLVSYGASHEGSIEGFSNPTRQALRNAERRLVAEHDRSVMARKTEIALKHVMDLQSVTDEYDGKIAELLNDRDRPDGDISMSRSPRTQLGLGDVEPKTYRPGTGEGKDGPRLGNGIASAAATTAGSGIKAVDFAVATNSPERTRPQPPTYHMRTKTLSRTSSAIPRAVPFQGRHTSTDLTSHLRARSSVSLSKLIPPTSTITTTNSATTTAATGPTPAVQPPAGFPPRGSSLTQTTSTPNLGRSTTMSVPSPVHEIDEKDFGTVASIVPTSTSVLASASASAQRKPQTLNKQRSFRHSSGLIYLQS